MSDYTGRFIWHELMTSEPDAAVDFYGKVVGWGNQVWEGAGRSGGPICPVALRRVRAVGRGRIRLAPA